MLGGYGALSGCQFVRLGSRGTNTHAFFSYLESRGLFGRLLVRSLLSVPPDGRSGPEPGLILLIKNK